MEFVQFQHRPGYVADEHRRRVLELIALRQEQRISVNPFSLPIPEFISLYRMPPHIMRDLVEIVRPHIPRRQKRVQIPVEIKVLCAVGFYAVGGYQRHHGRCYDLNLSQSSVSICIKEVTLALNSPQIMGRFVRFPTTNEEREAVIARNEVLGMPRTLGFVDGTLVKITPPPGERQVYRTRKGFTGLNVHIVCDADLNIMHVNARFPGSAADSFIYQSTPLQHVMRRAYQQSHCWLLGDSGYPHEPWLMIPLIHAPPGTPEFHYTKLHCHCRNAVERCIGVLKARWRCLLSDRTLHYKPVKAGQIVNACVVLHNFLNRYRVVAPRPMYEDNGRDPPDEVEEQDLNLQREADNVRRFLIEHADALRHGNN